ncbi:MAG: hypothetical protein IPK15_20800 [Verrucomicrobia bacterium]|nr:hypothetical protein [Verrucomicrobiota bacterium]
MDFRLPRIACLPYLVAALWLSGLQVPPAVAATVYWTNSSNGNYSDAANWAPNVVPAGSDAILFTNGGAYALTVDVNATNSSAFFHHGSVTQTVSAAAWRVTNEWRVGETLGTTSRVSAIAGSLVVTNEAGTAVLSVGRNGAGELAIRGGAVTADWLQASNGSRSVLSLGHGELTTLSGTTISNGSLTVGSTPNALFVWNVLGGTNRIQTGPFDYGGLTLGSGTLGFNVGGRARVSVAGSNTLLTVPGLDAYGRNELILTRGAKLRTGRVQWGIGVEATNNLLVISDPGTSWINDNVMYFGMHDGAQSMIISNGGYFKTGTGGPASSDIQFSGPAGSDNRILVTGSNSWFHCDGTARFLSSGRRSNSLLVSDGGKFWALRLTIGLLRTPPGTVLDVEKGSLWIGSLIFGGGTLRIGAGTGVIDQLTMTGGTNATLETLGNLFVGHSGNLNPGELRVGAGNSTIDSLSGDLRLGGWQLGAFPGTVGSVSMTGGRVFVTNAAHTASLVVGGGGTGTLRLNGVPIQADNVSVAGLVGGAGSLTVNGPTASLFTSNLFVGTAGVVIASNLATLQIVNCTAPASSVVVDGSTLEFITGQPVLSPNAISANNGIISFRNARGAALDLNNPMYLGRIQRSGLSTLQMIQSEGTASSPLVFRENDPSTWSRLVFNGGTSEVHAASLLVDASSAIVATNTVATISGAFTNRGAFVLKNSKVRFTGPVTLTESCTVESSEGVLFFAGGLHLPSTDFFVPAGLSVQASSISSDGGRLILNGGGIIPNDDGSVPGAKIFYQEGWVTYLDASAAPLTPPANLIGALGLELIRSTNVFVPSHSFLGVLGGYERLRLSKGSRWESDQLVIGAGGMMSYADSSAVISLGEGGLLVENGGEFRDDTGGASHVGFSPSASSSLARVSGSGAIWRAPNALSVGLGGIQNRLLVETGAWVVASSATVGGAGGNSNEFSVAGTGAIVFATNGLKLGGVQNQFLVQAGGGFNGSHLTANGTNGPISLMGVGTVGDATLLSLTGPQSRLQVMGGATLFTRSGDLNAASALTEISGDGSIWRNFGAMTVLAPSLQITTNGIVIKDRGTVSTGALNLTSPSVNRIAMLVIESGNLFVTNVAGTGNLTVNGRLELNRGLLHAHRFVANKVPESVLNFRAGKAEWIESELEAGIPLSLGDGTNLFTLNLLGGVNLWRGGMETRRHGRLTGRGTIVGTVTNRGSIGPAGEILIQDDLVLDSGSEAAFSISGPHGFPQNSSLVVTGNISLAGSLAVSIDAGATVSSSDTFTLIRFGSISSTFDNVAFGQRLLTRDRLASFRIDNTGSAMTASDFRLEDLDGDGIQDAWARQYFGVSPLLMGTGPNDLDGDRDGDGLSNRSEFLIGTDPNDSTSGLLIRAEPGVGGAMAIHFPYRPELQYQVSGSSDLLNWTNTTISEFQFDSSGQAIWSDSRSIDLRSEAY